MAAITVGPGANAGSGDYSNAVTAVEISTPANGSGFITLVSMRVGVAGAIKCGMFFWNGSNYQCRSAADLGSVGTGLVQKAVLLAVVLGDLLGFWIPSPTRLRYQVSSGANKIYSPPVGDQCFVGGLVPQTYPSAYYLMCLGEGTTDISSGESSPLPILVGGGII